MRRPQRSEDTNNLAMTRRAALRTAGVLIGLPLLAVLGAACAPATATTQAVASSAAVPVVNALSGQVDFWQVYANSAALPKISALIQQKYPQLKVNLLQFASNADVATKLVAAVAGGTPPGGVYETAPFFRDIQPFLVLLDSQEAIAGLQHASDLVVQNKLGPTTGALVAHAKTNDVAMTLDNAALAQNFRLLSNGPDWDTGPVVMGPAAPMSYAFVHCGGVVQGAKNPENSWIALSEFTGKDAEPFWMQANGWPTVRQSYLDLWIKDGSAPPTTRQNVLEWARQASLVTFPSGYNSKIGPVLTTIMQSVIAGKVSVRDAATQAAQQVTALLQKT